MDHTQVLVFTFLLSILRVSQAGYPNFLCPASPENNHSLFTCSSDCHYQHGSDSGVCGPLGLGDYNCYCGPPAGERIEVSLHCTEEHGKFSELCEADCQCSHAAKTGVCDFERQACICKGTDYNNTRCKFPTAQEFAEFTALIVPADSPAWNFLKYFLKPPKKCEDTATVSLESTSSLESPTDFE